MSMIPMEPNNGSWLHFSRLRDAHMGCMEQAEHSGDFPCIGLIRERERQHRSGAALRDLLTVGVLSTMRIELFPHARGRRLPPA